MTSVVANLVAVLSGQSVSSITIVSGGSGFSVAPQLIIDPPTTGVQATATCTISGGVIVSVSVTSGGSGYTTTPLVSVVTEGNNTVYLSDISTLQSDLTNLADTVDNQSITVTALSSSVGGLTPTGGQEGSVLFQGAVSDVLADTDYFIYDRNSHNLTLKNAVFCEADPSNDNHLVRKSNLDTRLSSKQDNLVYDSVPTSGSSKALTSGAIYTALASKQNSLTVDSTPTSASTNPVQSGGVYTALAGKANTFTTDSTATLNSTNPIQSTAVYQLKTTVDGLSSSSVSNKRYGVNAGVQTLSSVLSSIQSSYGYTQSVEIILSAGSHTNSAGAVFSFPNSTMYAVEGANSQPASLTGTFQIKQQDSMNALTRCRFSNIQFNGLVSITQTGSEVNDGRHYFKACSFPAGFTISGTVGNWITFYDCDFSGGTFTVPSTITGAITLYRCNMGTLSLNNVSALQVIFIDCTSLPSFTINATLAGRNSTTSASRLDATSVYQNGSALALSSSLSNYVLTSSLTSSITSGSTAPITSGAVFTGLSSKQNTLTFDSTPTSASTNPITSGGVYTALAGKANTFTTDSTPTSSSTNPVSSGGVFTALAGKANTFSTDSTPTSSSTNPVQSGGVFTALQNYLTTSTASSTYAPINNATHTGTLTAPNLALTNLSNTSTSNVLYYDSATKAVSYSTAPSGGSSLTSLTENTGASTLTLSSPYQLNFGSFSAGLANITYTTSGIAHTTSFLKFGTAGCSFAGSGNPYMKVSGITVSGFNNNLFCMECWFYPTVNTANQTLFNLTDSSNNEYIWVRINSSLNVVADFGNNGSSYNGGSGAQSTNACTLNTWNHVVFQYDGTGYQTYINGTRGLNYTQTGLNLPQFAFGQIYFGSYGLNNTPQNSIVSGYLDEIRYSNTYRYSGTTITTPTSAFTSDSSTVFLHHFNGTNGSTDFSVGQETPNPSLTKGALNASSGSIDCYNANVYNNLTLQSSNAFILPASASSSIGFGYPFTSGLSLSASSLAGPFMKTSAGWLGPGNITINRTDFAPSGSDNCPISMKLFFTTKYTGANNGKIGYQEIVIWKLYGNTSSTSTTTAITKPGYGTTTWSVAIANSGDNITLTFTSGADIYTSWVALGAI